MTEFARALDGYLRHVAIERGLAANTQAAYRRDLSGYVAWLGARGIVDWNDVTPVAIGEYLQSLASRDDTPLTASSRSRLLSSIRGLHRFLVDEGECDADATADLVAPKLPRRLPKAITIDQMAALIDAAGGESDVQIRDRALVELLYATGARISEVVGLNVDDVTAEDRLMRVRGKGGKQRIVPLGSYARDALDAYLASVGLPRPSYADLAEWCVEVVSNPAGASEATQEDKAEMTAAAGPTASACSSRAALATGSTSGPSRSRAGCT
jgi:integrase/recombinase XerD